MKMSTSHLGSGERVGGGGHPRVDAVNRTRQEGRDFVAPLEWHIEQSIVSLFPVLYLS